ncbi:MAG: lamin tail domain-containing protein [Lentisphaerae bacterium]|nr:lamin tail domain-containing protein [Lentisphaerota bacterium]
MIRTVTCCVAVCGLLVGLLTLPPTTSAADPQLVINELMYHHYESWPTNQPYANTNHTEFIELFNAGASSLVLTNYQFDTGIAYTFTGGTLAPNNYLVICEDLTAFTNAYPSVTNVVGPYSGSLARGGERVTLSRRDNGSWVTEDTLQYIDDDDSDGTGYSLELINPGFARLRNQYYGDWVASSTVSGTPGRVNSRYLPLPLPVAGDVMHDPPLPPAGSSVKVTVRATGRDGDAVNVALEYRKDASPTNAWASTNMVDHGAEGDRVAGDGIFTAWLPPATNGPNPALVMAEGEMLEFRIRVTDAIGSRTFPATNRAEVATGPFSYLVKFGDDPETGLAYPGEYRTYHMLMTKAKRTEFENRPVSSNIPLDCTLVVSDGTVIYNAGIRLRGSGSRNGLPTFYGNFRIGLPTGMQIANQKEVNLNWENALAQYMGMRLTRQAGLIASDVQLARVWLNETLKTANQGIYCKIEGVGPDYIDNHYPLGEIGNIYEATGYDPPNPTYDGSLIYSSNLNTYPTHFISKLGNPYTAWFDLQNLTYLLSRPTSEFPTILTNRVNVKGWSRLYAANVCMDNSEAGYYAVPGYGDELRMFCSSITGLFDMFPWDYSDSLGMGQSASTYVDIWGFTFQLIPTYLYSRPILPYYTGDVLDIATNLLSDANMNALFDSMGSKMTPTLRNQTLTHVQQRRNLILAALNTSLTVNGLTNGAPVLLVPSTNGAVRLSLAGTAPQGYTDRVLINGNAASWTPRYPTWTMTNVVTVAGDVADVTINTSDPEGRLLRTLAFKAVAQRSPVTITANITTDTTWAPAAGIYIISNNVTVTAGAKLTIQPQTVVLMAPGKTLTVNGRLDVLGSTNAPVQILPQGGTTPWLIAGGGTNAILVISNAVCSLGRITVDGGATLRIYDSALSGSQDTNGIIQATGAASVQIARCVVRDFNRTRFDNSPTVIDQSLFESMSAVGIEINGAATTTVRRTTIRQPLGTDGITFANAAGLVTNVLIEGMSGTGVAARASAVTVVNALVEACGTALHVSEASSVMARNSTFVDNDIGVNGPAALTNMIVWSASSLAVTNGPPTATTSDILLPGTGTYAGSGNLNRNPFFRSATDRDYQLGPFSPCLGVATGGGNLGVPYPTGANPFAPTNLSLAASSNSVQLTWTDLSPDETGFEIQRSDDDGRTWSTVGMAPAGATEFTNGDVKPNTPYQYRLRATHARGASTFTDAAGITTSLQSMTQLLRSYFRITEIMYHPAETGELTEFLEFKNISTNVLLDLSGLYTDHGSTASPPYRFSFTNGTLLGPQEFFVLARNAAGFAAVHPGVFINDTYDDDDKLGNGGEDIWVRDRSGIEVIRFDFGDGSSGRSWYTSTDGAGYSLVPVNPDPYTDDMDDDLSWRASSAIGGSPGADDPEPFASGIVINEALAHTDPPLEDAVEIRNVGTNSVNVAGWYLSDDFNDLRKYRIPPSPARILAPGAYGVLYAGLTFESTNAATPFQFTEFGTEPVILSASTGTNLTGYRAVATFRGAIENGVSFGRYTCSDGRVDFVAMAARTFGMDNPATVQQFRTGTGALNSGPKVGPVVINEIMYNPGPGGKEFIELRNITAGNVPLYSLTTPTNTWRLRDAVSYTFPPNIALTPGERLLVVGVDPAEFRQLLGIDSGTRIFGPFSGELANGGEPVELVKPEAQELNGFVPQVMVDRVDYRDAAPWPAAADNAGASLERLNASAYGDDATNWVAVTIGGTPGAPNNTTSIPTVGFRDVTDRRTETNTVYQIDVILQPAVSATVTVSYILSDGTAAAGSDFTLTPGTLTFWPHETLKSIPLTIIDDSTPAGEPDETIEITLTNVSANALLGGNRVYTHTIVDNDAGTLAAPIILPSRTTDFTNSVSVEIIPTVPYSEIYYTTDGRVPERSDTFYQGPFSVQTSTRLTARTFLGAINSGNWTSVLLRAQAIPPGWRPPPPPPGVSVPVRGSLDDGYQPNNLLAVQPAGLTIQMLASTTERAFFRFYGANIPPGADVTNAYLQFTAATNSGGTANLNIRGEATDYALPLEAVKTNISVRVTTTNVATWSPTTWTISERGAAQRTPNLAAIVREIVSRPGWNPTNALAFIFQVPAPTSISRVHAFDGNPDQAAVLHVEWTEAPPPPEPEPPLFLNTSYAGPGSFTVTWLSATNLFYTVYRSTNLVIDRPGLILAAGLPGHPSGTNAFTDTAATNPPAFYSITGSLTNN